MLQIKQNMLVSTMLECPVGVPSFFLVSDNKWERNDKECIIKYTNNTSANECFFTIEQYLETDMYCNLFAREVLFAKKIPLSHWHFNYN